MISSLQLQCAGATKSTEFNIRIKNFKWEISLLNTKFLTCRNFGDEGLFFLAESLAYNQTLEEVNLSANGITGNGLKAFDGVLQSNFALKTLDLSGNPIGDEGAKMEEHLLEDKSDDSILLLLVIRIMDALGNYGSSEYDEWANHRQTWKHESASIIEPPINFIVSSHSEGKKRPRWALIDKAYMHCTWRSSQSTYHLFRTSGNISASDHVALLMDDLLNLCLYSYETANAASGMAVHDDCKLRFLDLKAKRTFRFVVYKIEEKQKQVVVEKVGEPALSYDDFAASLPADECRYAVYDFDFVLYHWNIIESFKEDYWTNLRLIATSGFPGKFSHSMLYFKNRRDANKRRPGDENYHPKTLYLPPQFLNSLTGGQRQWWEFKSINMDKLLFFKMGKFYELFEMDAHVGAKELDLQYMKGTQPHCGFPEKNFSMYIEKLAQKGYRVLVVEQIETPAQLDLRRKEQDSKDKVVKREICVVVTKEH
ncbi:hypothetical protein POM88_000745 [Heracleum sosnowskyi]|uniref:ADF-H domain-containing protein n=1 Tax=Heracleum sosnowskyi TaxID=360622 RepID=A0AAD8JEU7_9APIA|nr:hypothetical protein POM88_000745 [Heracleum sosnowskyi]